MTIVKFSRLADKSVVVFSIFSCTSDMSPAAVIQSSDGAAGLCMTLDTTD